MILLSSLGVYPVIKLLSIVDVIWCGDERTEAAKQNLFKASSVSFPQSWLSTDEYNREDGSVNKREGKL